MKVLFVHQNFPGQYRHVAPRLAAGGHAVLGLGEEPNVRRQLGATPGVKCLGYRMPPEEVAAKPGVLGRSLESALRRAGVVARAAARIRAGGFVPDVVCAHIGWGEAIFLKDVFPEAQLQLYCEFFYRPEGSDVGFDPEFPSGKDVRLRLRLMNAPLLLALQACDAGLTATRWQHAQLPAEFSARVSVVHEGIDTQRVAPRADAELQLPGTGLRLTAREQVVTYTTRNFEPYRGFHIFMRALPEIQRRCPRARIVLVGGDRVSYSPRLPEGQTYRARALKEVGHKLDMDRVHFLPWLAYEQYVSLLQISAAHVYLTYPFVLSWSLLESMAAGCHVIASRTAPVEEVARDGENAVQVDFFSPQEIAQQVERALREPEKFREMRQRARETVVQGYDLERHCLPRQLALIEQLAGLSAPAAPAPAP